MPRGLLLTVSLLAWLVVSTAPVEAQPSSFPQLSLPFGQGAHWVVVRPADGRHPDRATAGALHFTPSAGAASARDETILAPAAGHVRILNVRPPIIPLWCAYDGEWIGPQQDIVLDINEHWSVLLSSLDDITVVDGEAVTQGRPLGTLSRSTCNGNRAIEIVLWYRDQRGVVSYPFGSLGSYTAADLTPGAVVIGDL